MKLVPSMTRDWCNKSKNISKTLLRNNNENELIKRIDWVKVWVKEKSFQRTREYLSKVGIWDSKRESCTWRKTLKCWIKERWDKA